MRLHEGSEPARLNRALDAHAFTVGQDIFLGAGKNDLESTAGQHLLAHELTHTIQQGAGGGNVARHVSSDGDAAMESPRTVVVQRDPLTPSAAPAAAPTPAAAPAPASGVQGPSASAPGAAASDNDPIDLPVLGDASITLTPGMSVALDLPDLREFKIGKGTLTTEPIPLGESGITAEVEVGSQIHCISSSRL